MQNVGLTHARVSIVDNEFFFPGLHFKMCIIST